MPNLRRIARVTLLVLLASSLASLALAQRRPEDRAAWEPIEQAYERAGLPNNGCGNYVAQMWAACGSTEVPPTEVEAYLADAQAKIVDLWTSLGIDQSSRGGELIGLDERVEWPLEAGELSTTVEYNDSLERLFVTVIFDPDEEYPSPGNDHYVNAAVITGASGSDSGTNRGAWTYRYEPDYFSLPEVGDVGVAGVWWSWTAPSDGTYAFDTAGSSFDTLMHVYRALSDADAYPELELAGGNDDAAGLGLQSRVEFTAVAGATYKIRIGGFEDATGDIMLNWAPTGTDRAASQPAPGDLSPEAQALVSDPDDFVDTAERCRQQVADLNTFGLMSVSLSRAPATSATVELTIGVRGMGAVFGIEPFVWFDAGPGLLDRFSPTMQIRSGIGDALHEATIHEALYGPDFGGVETFAAFVPTADVAQWLASGEMLTVGIYSQGQLEAGHFVPPEYLEVLRARFGQSCL